MPLDLRNEDDGGRHAGGGGGAGAGAGGGGGGHLNAPAAPVLQCQHASDHLGLEPEGEGGGHGGGGREEGLRELEEEEQVVVTLLQLMLLPSCRIRGEPGRTEAHVAAASRNSEMMNRV